MAQIRIVGSSSRGNGYAIVTDEEVLLLECGVPLRDTLRAINYETSKVSGVLVSHKHGDHAGFITDYTLRFKVFSCKDVADKHSRVTAIAADEWHTVGGFSILPFLCKHDVENYGYIIKHKDFGSLMFGTDTFAYPTIFSGVDHFMVEANYSDELIADLAPARRNRLLVSHMEIGYAIKYLHQCNASSAKTITLIHLSDSNSNEEEFKKSVEGEFGVPTYIADKGTVINI